MNPSVRCVAACYAVHGDDPCPCSKEPSTAIAELETMLYAERRASTPQPPRGQRRPREDGEYRRYRAAFE